MGHLIKHLILYTWKKNKTTSSIINQKKKRKWKMLRASMCFVSQGDLSDACTNFTSQTDIGFSVQTREPKSQAVSNGKKNHHG